jgi:hypothetical protein
LNAETNFLYCTGKQLPGDNCTTGNAGSNAVDVINFHVYQKHEPLEASIVKYMTNAKAILQPQDAAKPIWNGEGSWGKAEESDFKTPDSQASYVARYLLMGRSLGLASEYWYAYGSSCGGIGTLFCPATGLNKAGYAWTKVYDWLVGASMTPCSENGSVWTCDLTLANGAQAEILWDSDPKYYCGQTCPTHSYVVPDRFTEYEDLDGTKGAIQNHTISIGIKPVRITTPLPPI